MADVTVVAAEVLPIASSTGYTDGILGATVAAGELVYLDTATNTYKLADCNASAATAVLAGQAQNGGVAGQPVKVANSGTIDPGFTVVVGKIYVLSATAGGIAPVTDLATGMYVSILGVGITASVLRINIINSGVAVP